MLAMQDVLPGDILLCRAKPTPLSPGKPVRYAIEKATSSPYTHAAIATSRTEVADSRPMHGVTTRPLSDLLGDALHVTVFRHPNAWDGDRIDGLQRYAADLKALKAGYNYRDALRYVENKQEHDASVMAALERHVSE